MTERLKRPPTPEQTEFAGLLNRVCMEAGKRLTCAVCESSDWVMVGPVDVVLTARASMGPASFLYMTCKKCGHMLQFSKRAVDDARQEGVPEAPAAPSPGGTVDAGKASAAGGFKVVRFDNFDRDDWHGDQYEVPGTPGMTREAAQLLADWINQREGSNSENFFKVKPVDYVLPPKWEP